jgi:hypothetical protein
MDETNENNLEERGVARQPISWKGHEYLHFKKTTDWYWALGLITVAGAMAALVFNNVLFAILILILGFVLAIFAAREPEEVSFTISQRGVRINDTLYPYQTLEAFGIEEMSPEHIPQLILRSKKILVPNIVIPLQQVTANEVHDFLHNYLHEEELVEPLTHKVMEWLGF